MQAADNHERKKKAKEYSTTATHDGFNDAVSDRLDPTIGVIPFRDPHVFLAGTNKNLADLIRGFGVISMTLPTTKFDHGALIAPSNQCFVECAEILRATWIL
jgi:hypothetical protein